MGLQTLLEVSKASPAIKIRGYLLAVPKRPPTTLGVVKATPTTVAGARGKTIGRAEEEGGEEGREREKERKGRGHRLQLLTQ